MAISSLMYYSCLHDDAVHWFCLGINWSKASSTHGIHVVDHNYIHTWLTHAPHTEQVVQ